MYTYCYNNPIQFVDPSGHVTITWEGYTREVSAAEAEKEKEHGWAIVSSSSSRGGGPGRSDDGPEMDDGRGGSRGSGGSSGGKGSSGGNGGSPGGGSRGGNSGGSGGKGRGSSSSNTPDYNQMAIKLMAQAQVEAALTGKESAQSLIDMIEAQKLSYGSARLGGRIDEAELYHQRAEILRQKLYEFESRNGRDISDIVNAHGNDAGKWEAYTVNVTVRDAIADGIVDSREATVIHNRVEQYNIAVQTGKNGIHHDTQASADNVASAIKTNNGYDSEERLASGAYVASNTKQLFFKPVYDDGSGYSARPMKYPGGTIGLGYSNKKVVTETIINDPYSAIRDDAVTDAMKLINPILEQAQYGFWHGGIYTLAEDTYAYFYYEQLKNEVSSYKSLYSSLETAIVPATIIDSYNTVSENSGPMPVPAVVAYTAVLSLANLSDHYFDTEFKLTDGEPGFSDAVEIVEEWQQKSNNVAIALSKFEYVMNSDYKYLMLGFEGRKEFTNQLGILREQVENRDFIKYDGINEKKVYKQSMIEYIDKIYNMNIDFNRSNEGLHNDFRDINKTITDMDAKMINDIIIKK